MHIHVHFAARHGQEEKEPRLHALGHGGAVSLVRSLHDPGVVERATVDEEVDATESRTRQVGALDRAVQAEAAALGGEGDEPGLVRIGPDRADAGGQVPSRGQVQHAAPVDLEHEAHVQVGQRQRVQDFRDGPGLHTRAAQEPGSHRRVQEEVLHVHGRPVPAGGVLDPLHLPRERAQAGSRVLALGRGFDDHPRHGGDRRERLPAEPQRVDVAQVFGVADLAGGVTVQTEQNILADHAASVVGDDDATLSALLDGHPDGTRPRVERVLDQLLHHRSRALHDLAGGDLVRHRVRQHPDPRAGGALRHGRGPRSLPPPPCAGPSARRDSSSGNPKKRAVLAQVSSATCSSDSPRMRATARATWTT